jgi:hypothetical protein
MKAYILKKKRFSPRFTAPPCIWTKGSELRMMLLLQGRDEMEELTNLDSCEYIWERGVGFAQTPTQVPQHHHNR